MNAGSYIIDEHLLGTISLTMSAAFTCIVQYG